MTWAQFASAMLLNLLGVASPGPDILLVTRLATRSRAHAYRAVAGVQTGALIWITATVLGAAALFRAYPAAVGVIELVGGVFLVLMGRGMAASGLRQRREPPADAEAAAAALGTLWSAWRTGLATNLSNPKIVLFLAAIVGPLLPPDPSLGEAALLVLALWLPSIAYFWLLATVVSTEAVRRRLLGAGAWIDIGAGVIFLLIGAVLAWRGAAALF